MLVSRASSWIRPSTLLPDRTAPQRSQSFSALEVIVGQISRWCGVGGVVIEHAYIAKVSMCIFVFAIQLCVRQVEVVMYIQNRNGWAFA